MPADGLEHILPKRRGVHLVVLAAPLARSASCKPPYSSISEPPKRCHDVESDETSHILRLLGRRHATVAAPRQAEADLQQAAGCRKLAPRRIERRSIMTAGAFCSRTVYIIRANESVLEVSREQQRESESSG
jgi:hypothetical protein